MGEQKLVVPLRLRLSEFEAAVLKALVEAAGVSKSATVRRLVVAAGTRNLSASVMLRLRKQHGVSYEEQQEMVSGG